MLGGVEGACETASEDGYRSLDPGRSRRGTFLGFAVCGYVPETAAAVVWLSTHKRLDGGTASS